MSVWENELDDFGKIFVGAVGGKGPGVVNGQGPL